jgi:hypothetical protein
LLGSLVLKRKKCKVLGFKWCLHNYWKLKQFFHFFLFFKNKIKDLGPTLSINLLYKRLELYDVLKIKSSFVVVNWGFLLLTFLCCLLDSCCDVVAWSFFQFLLHCWMVVIQLLLLLLDFFLAIVQFFSCCSTFLLMFSSSKFRYPFDLTPMCIGWFFLGFYSTPFHCRLASLVVY